MNGFIIGRFIPPHSGHTYLIEYALRSCDHLYIMLCAMADDPIPGPLRYEWMKQLYPSADIVYVDEENPEASRDKPEAPQIWAKVIKKYIKKPISIVFASEPYVEALAKALHARYILVDEGRSIVPVSGNEIRNTPVLFWDFIPPPIQYYFVKSIALTLPQAPTLVRRLASMYDTSYCDATSKNVELAKKHAKRFLFINASDPKALQQEYDMLVVQKKSAKKTETTAETPTFTLALSATQDFKDSITAIQKYIRTVFLTP